MRHISAGQLIFAALGVCAALAVPCVMVTVALGNLTVSRATRPANASRVLGGGLESELKELQAKLLEREQALEKKRHAFEANKAKLVKDTQRMAALDRENETLARQLAERRASFSNRLEDQKGTAMAARSDLEKRRQELTREIAETEKKAAELRKLILERRSSSEGKRSGRAAWQYIECTSGGVVLIPQGTRIAAAQIQTSPELAQAFKVGSIAFLVRPDGFASFQAARQAAEAAGARIGYEPIDRDWQLGGH